MAHRNRPRTALQIQRQLATSTDSDDEDLFLSGKLGKPTQVPTASNALPGVGGVGVGLGGLPALAVTSSSSYVRPTRERHLSCESSDAGSSYHVMGCRDRAESCSSIVDGLLFEIYDRWHFPQRDSLDSDTFTECSSTSDAFFGRTDVLHPDLEEKHSVLLNKAFLESKDVKELKRMKSELQHRSAQQSTRLIRQLKRRDSRLVKVLKNCDVITAILQASSLKRRIDSKIRFSIEPLPGDDAFHQWRDAMKAVARLPMGIPPEFRKKVWLALADNHLRGLRIDWEKTKKFAFNERSNPDDNKLGMQIVKDLHRTGCTGFSGQDNEEDRAVLKRVLLGYARWNKAVGYCQGFNVLAALILDVVDRREEDALKVMIFLVDHVLPDSYFANNLRALSVDMAVFRDLLGIQLPELSKHLDYLQNAARDLNSGANYEPPLTNVFTMQWFLTLFATCLPEATALRVWDSVLLEGSEILLRTALAIWGRLSDHIMAVQSADEFYTTMGVLTQQMLDCGMVDGDELVKTVYTMAPTPFPQLSELREKYTYNITPFQAAMSTGRKPVKSLTNIFSDDDEVDEEDMVDSINCFTGIFPPQPLPSRNRPLGDADRSQSGSSFDVSKISPGAYGAQPENIAPGLMAYAERMSLDVSQLKRQYGRLRERQKQAHIILAAASARHYASRHGKHGKQTKAVLPGVAVAPIESPVAVNHLFIGRKSASCSKRNRTIAQAPNIVPLFPNTPVTAKTKSDGSDHAKRPARHGRMLSTDSTDGSMSSTSVAGTIHESDRTESTSDVSTVDGGESQDINSDLIDLDAERPGSGAKEGGENTTDTDNEGNVHANDCSDSGCSSDTSPVRAVDGCPAAASEAADSVLASEHAEDPELCDNEDSENESSSNKCAHDEAEAAATRTLNFEENSISQGPDFRGQASPSSEAPTAQKWPNGKKPTLLQLAQGAPAVQAQDSEVASEAAVAKTKHSTSDLEQEYVNSLTRHRAQRAGQQGDTDPSSDPTSQSQAKLFNPFPIQHINQRKAQNGIRLGLYAANNLPKLETGMMKTQGMKHIGRAQLNACLHRQYMAEIKQQARVGKR